MRILNHRLFDGSASAIRFEASPNTGGKFAKPGPRLLVVHYTAAGPLEGTIDWFRQSRARASAHIVIDRKGTVVQMVPFDRIAWHAGRSSWQGLSGLNRHSLGIELCNWGPLGGGGTAAWRSWTGSEVPATDCREARHRHECRTRGWERYPEAQIMSALEVAATLVDHYGLTAVLGHDDIAPTRKLDPGPIFPMDEFRAQLFGQAEDAAAMAYVAVDRLNIRAGPDLTQPVLAEGPLMRGTELEFIEAQNAWRLVNVFNDAGRSWLTGWVHSAYTASVLEI